MDLKEDFDQEANLDDKYIDNEITNPIFNQEVKDQISNTKLNSPENEYDINSFDGQYLDTKHLYKNFKGKNGLTSFINKQNKIGTAINIYTHPVVGEVDITWGKTDDEANSNSKLLNKKKRNGSGLKHILVDHIKKEWNNYKQLAQDNNLKSEKEVAVYLIDKFLTEGYPVNDSKNSTHSIKLWYVENNIEYSAILTKGRHRKGNRFWVLTGFRPDTEVASKDIKDIFNNGSIKEVLASVFNLKALQPDNQDPKATTDNNYSKNNLNSAEEFENTIEILSTETLAYNIFNNVDIIKHK